ncbi:hypothetical protein L218DRAFT_1009171 [Marasmius fiardii PR-910]|nr:hypothetical protein L218DRAFT_1009171 [Marasmius fiardii PR-910]
MSEPVTTLQRIGNDLVTNVVCTTVHTILIGIYSVLVVKTASILLRIRKHNPGMRSPLITLAAVLFMYVIALTTWTINLVNIVGELRITLVKDPDVDLDTKYGWQSNFGIHRIAVIGPLYGYMTCIGDAVIIWRAYVFWASSNVRYIAMALPIAALVGSLVCATMLSYCVGRLGGELVLGTFEHPVFCRKIQTASYVFPAATTAMATFLIVIKVWSLLDFSRAKGASNTRLSKRSRLEDVVILLIESGIAYFLFFLAQAILIAPPIKSALDASPSLTFAGNVFSEQTSSIVGMYPTIIICLVHTNRSALDTSLLSTAVEHEPKDHKRALDSFQAAAPHRSDGSSGKDDLESGGALQVLGIGSSPDSHDEDEKVKHKP